MKLISNLSHDPFQESGLFHETSQKEKKKKRERRKLNKRLRFFAQNFIVQTCTLFHAGLLSRVSKQLR